jgi:hypothetical protein
VTYRTPTRGALLAVLLACLLSAVLAAPALAASSGSLMITNVAGTQLTFTATVTYDCPNSGPYAYCGWFSTVRQTTPNADCTLADPLLWVGSITEQPSATFAQTEQPYGWFSGPQPVRLCLYLYAGGADQLLAHADWSPTPPTPAPTPSPSPPPSPVSGSSSACSEFEYQEDAQDFFDGDPLHNAALDTDGDGIACEQLPHLRQPARARTLTLGQAQRSTRTALRRRYGGRFNARTGYSSRCGRLSRIRFRCSVAWRHNGRYHGTVTLWTSREDDESFINWRIRVSYERAPTPTPAPAPSPSPKPPSSDCDPSYPTVCIPSPPPDLDCPDISARDFVVRGSDPHGFDGDNDGIGCET